MNDIRATCYQDIFVTGGCPRLLKGAFDTFSDEGISRSSFPSQLFFSLIGNNKSRLVLPPAGRGAGANMRGPTPIDGAGHRHRPGILNLIVWASDKTIQWTYLK